MAINVLADCTHLVLCTGYTARLLDSSSITPECFDEAPWYLESDDDEDVDMKTFLARRGGLYIYDDLYGQGMAFLTDDKNDHHDANEIQESLTKDDQLLSSGLIVFKLRIPKNSNVSALISTIIENITKIPYCSCLSASSWYSMYKLKIGEKNILYMDFDCESG